MDILSYISDQFHIRRELVQFVFECEEDVKPVFRTLQETAQSDSSALSMHFRKIVFLHGIFMRLQAMAMEMKDGKNSAVYLPILSVQRTPLFLQC